MMVLNTELELQRRQFWIDCLNKAPIPENRVNYANQRLAEFDKTFPVTNLSNNCDNRCPHCNTPMTQQTYGKYQCNNPACGEAFP